MGLGFILSTDIVHYSTFVAVVSGLCLIAWRTRNPVKELGLMGCTEVLSKDISALIAFICIVFCFCMAPILEASVLTYLYSEDKQTSKFVATKYSLDTSRLIIYGCRILMESLVILMLFYLHKAIRVKPCLMAKCVAFFTLSVLITHFIRAVDRVVLETNLFQDIYPSAVLALNLSTVLVMLVYIPSITIKEKIRISA